LEEWLNINYQLLLKVNTYKELFSILWNILAQKIKNDKFVKYTPNDTLSDIAISWIEGKPYFEIFNSLKSNNIKMGEGKRPPKLTIEHIIEICEQAFSYEGSMILSSLIELLELQENSQEREQLKDNLKFIQKQLKYGLDTSNKIIIYELGFTDRIITQDLEVNLCDRQELLRNEIKRLFKLKHKNLNNVLEKYPSYFNEMNT